MFLLQNWDIRYFEKSPDFFFKTLLVFGQCLKNSPDMKDLGSDLFFFWEIITQIFHERVLNYKIL